MRKSIIEITINDLVRKVKDHWQQSIKPKAEDGGGGGVRYGHSQTAAYLILNSLQNPKFQTVNTLSNFETKKTQQGKEKHVEKRKYRKRHGETNSRLKSDM